MFRTSDFGERYSRRTAAAELMLDLADAMAAAAPVYMLGGGNPARIAEVEAVYRRRLTEIAADAGQFGRFAGQYSDPAGDPSFRDAVAGALADEYGWRLERRNVAITGGSQLGFFFLFNWLSGLQADGSRRRLLLPLAPEYIGYADLGVSDGMLCSRPALIERTGDGFFKYRLDTANLRLPDELGAICVSRPTNPSGNVLTTTELERLDAAARQRGVPLVIDAAYGLPFPGLQFEDDAAFWNDNVILCLSLSKLGLPGTRTGIVVAHESVVEAITAFNATAALAPAGTAATIVEPLLRSGELARLCRDVVRPHYADRCRQAIDWLRFACADLPLVIHRPEGAFFLWLWFPGLPVTSAELYRRLKARGVYVLSGHHFFFGLEAEWPHRNECLRINYSQAPESVERGIAIIAEEVRRAYG
jgi:valine--pyruvate aminotransferase